MTATDDYLEVNKTAKPVDGTVNTWDITLEIEGRKTEVITADIVLVIDTSGSMGDDSKLTNTINAAKAFVSQFNGNENVRIGIVTFAEGASNPLELTVTDNAGVTQITNILDQIRIAGAVGGTHTQGGIYQARSILDDVPLAQKADKQYIVMLTDGDPTYSYARGSDATSNVLNNNSSWLQDWVYIYEGPPDRWSREYRWIRLLNQGYARSLTSNYLARIGSGRDNYGIWQTTTGQNGRNYYVRHSDRAIYEGNLVRNSGYTMHTIGFAIADGSVADSTMREVATTPNHYWRATADPNSVIPVFEAISQEIQSEIDSVTQNMEVIDLMGSGFSIQDVDSISASQGTFSYGTLTDTLIWNAGDLNADKPESEPGVKYASITYRLELDPSMLDVTDFDTIKWFAANQSAELTHDGDPLTFPVPEIDPLLIHFTKELYDVRGNRIDDVREFTVTLTDGANNTETVVLTSGADPQPVYLTTLRPTGNYTVTEILAEGQAVNLEDYDITIEVDGFENPVNVSGNYTPDPRGDSNTQEDIGVVIKNKERPLALDVLKVDGSDETYVLEGATFELRLTEDGSAATDVGGQPLVGTTGTNGYINFTNIPPGTYFLVETSAPTGYNVLAPPIQLTITGPAYRGNVNDIIITTGLNGISIAEGTDGIPVITVENLLTGTFPNTGGWGTLWIYASGTSLVTFAIIGIWSLERRRRL